MARSSPDDKHLLVTRLNGTALPRNREAWEEQHPELDWNVDRDNTLPGYWDEVCMHARVCSRAAAWVEYGYRVDFFGGENKVVVV